MATLVPFRIVVGVSVRFRRRVTTCVLGEIAARGECVRDLSRVSVSECHM